MCTSSSGVVRSSHTQPSAALDSSRGSPSNRRRPRARTSTPSQARISISLCWKHLQGLRYRWDVLDHFEGVVANVIVDHLVTDHLFGHSAVFHTL